MAERRDHKCRRICSQRGSEVCKFGSDSWQSDNGGGTHPKNAMKPPKVVKWESLTAQERLKLAKEVVARRRKRWLRIYKDVFAVSAAPHRTRGRGLTFRLHPEVVIRFYVSDKPPQPNAHAHVARRPRLPGHVPQTVGAFFVSHGRKCALPFRRMFTSKQGGSMR